ncbi:hypothetical protein ATANTOWER_000889 [Ataeniobius toweri]|nr:hypothetical protein [Ataeniobius toweri]
MPLWVLLILLFYRFCSNGSLFTSLVVFFSSQVKRWRLLPGVQNNGCSFQVSAAPAAAGLGSTCQSQALEFGL